MKSARLAAEQRDFEDARTQVEAALAAEPNQADVRLLKAQLLIVAQDFPAATNELEQYLKARPADTRTRRLRELCRDAQPDDLTRLLPIASVLMEQQASSLVDGLLRKYGKDSHEARQVLLKLYRERLEKVWPGKGNSLTIDARGLHLEIANDQAITDLTPLRGMPLTSLHLPYTQVTDLTPLRWMLLTSLSCASTRASDLTPLRGMPLTTLYCGGTQVSDLTPLRGMPLTVLQCHNTRVTDLTPLAELKLQDLRFTPKNITRGLDTIRAMPSLKTIGISNQPEAAWPAAEFWQRFEKGEFK